MFIYEYLTLKSFIASNYVKYAAVYDKLMAESTMCLFNQKMLLKIYSQTTQWFWIFHKYKWHLPKWPPGNTTMFEIFFFWEESARYYLI